MTDIGLMVRTVNPVQGESQALTNDELSAVFLLAQQRSGEMDTKQTQAPVKQPEPKRRSGWLVASAAFAGVIVVVGAVWLFGGTAAEDVPPATTPPTTAVPPDAVASTTSATVVAVASLTDNEIAVIATYEKAVNSADAAAIAATLGPDFGHTDNRNPGWVSRVDLWTQQEAYWTAEGATVSYTMCEPKGAVVTCLETRSGPVQSVMMLRDWTYQMDFDIQDDVIVAMHGFPLVWPDQFVEQDLRARIADWARESDPDIADMLEGCGPGSAGEGYDLAAAALCGEYVQLWANAGRP